MLGYLSLSIYLYLYVCRHTRIPYTMASLAGAKSQECHICLEELRQDLVACPCGHVFHHACILQALQVNTQCPICRRFAAESHLINLYFDVPGETPSPSRDHHHHHGVGTSHYAARDGNDGNTENGNAAELAHIEKLNTRVSALVERLQWQKKQYDLLIVEMKRVRHQSEQLVMDKQALMQRIAALEANKSVLTNKVAKYQMELSRQAEATRQVKVNQSIINYLNTCDAEAMEEEIQNPRELIMALKKACTLRPCVYESSLYDALADLLFDCSFLDCAGKFRHDQYQKVVKDKMRLKAMLQSHSQQPSGDGKSKMKSSSNGSSSNGFDSNSNSKRHYATEFSNAPHPLELKKRKTDPTSNHSGSSMSAAQVNPSSSSSAAAFTPRTESAGFRANAYSDVSVRPVTTARPTFTRSSYNPNQYGAYNMTPANEPPVQNSGHAICRRGYDETGKLTNFFLPQNPKRNGGAPSSSDSRGAPQQKTIPSMQHLLQSTQANGGGGSLPNQQRSTETAGQRGYALTSWLRKDS